MKSAGSPFTGLEPDVCTVVDNIIEIDESGKHKLYSMEDMDELLEQIQTKKAECSKNKQRDAQLYQALSCMEVIIEPFDLWDDDDKTSEITHYRRFASLLDIIFKKKTGIKLNDGETGSISTKLERETNKAIFHATNISPTYSRKIDLLLKCKDAKTTIEMPSNEWKSASVAKNIQLAQQCKNLRVNTAILKNLKNLV
ncbi:hypothetical protein CU098_003524 [Rhizopus stolonifer]|uniref:Uncharacterized protein n=1 Tax=Rhizopus stolonifer TaxID=4846 RepID=A0A367J2M2_RHIST|nr:hypothetical protein CU098_003524 [Rhizopus stolonifer]